MDLPPWQTTLRPRIHSTFPPRKWNAEDEQRAAQRASAPQLRLPPGIRIPAGSWYGRRLPVIEQQEELEGSRSRLEAPLLSSHSLSRLEKVPEAPADEDVASVAHSPRSTISVAASHRSSVRSIARSASTGSLLVPPTTRAMLMRNSSETFELVPEDRASVVRSSRSSVNAMKRDVLMAEREKLHRELHRVETSLKKKSTTVSSASTFWYVMHRQKSLALAPSSKSFKWLSSDGPRLPEPGVSLPKPGDWVKKEEDE
jgi:hypothetical protein